MTREKIIKKIEEYSLKHYSCDPTIKYEWWELSNTDKAGLADELLSMLEQEKKEQVNNFVKDLLLQTIFWGENDNIWFNYETLKKVAKEYGVEL